MANAKTNSPAFSQSKMAKEKPQDPIAKTANVMDFRPSKGLAAGLKRVGGRSGISRLTGRKHPGSAARTILKKYT